MKNRDYLVKATAFQKQIRAYAIRSTAMVSEAQRRHDTWPTTSAALGRTMTAAMLLAAMLKGRERYSVRFEGNGPVGHILADANAIGEVRGYVHNPHVDFPLNAKGKLDVSKAIGNEGLVSVIKDLGLKQTFTGQVPIISGEVGEDIAYYLLNSEQIPSSVGVGVLVNPDKTIAASGGFLIQALPGVKEETLTQLEETIKKAPTISAMIQQGKSPEEILKTVLGEGKIEFLETLPVSFKCTCSRERTQRIFIKLGKEEIQSMIDEDGKAEAECNFCKEKYLFSEAELKALIVEIDRLTAKKTN